MWEAWEFGTMPADHVFTLGVEFGFVVNLMERQEPFTLLVHNQNRHRIEKFARANNWYVVFVPRNEDFCEAVFDLIKKR